jgi:hypothetical protein
MLCQKLLPLLLSSTIFKNSLDSTIVILNSLAFLIFDPPFLPTTKRLVDLLMLVGVDFAPINIARSWAGLYFCYEER